MIFVTGGTGLVGSHLLYELTSSGKSVRALKRKTSNLNQVLQTFSRYTRKSQELFDQIEWIEGNLQDYFSLEKMVRGVTEIYHCAATVSFHTRERSKMITNNVEGTANLVNAALENGIKKFCHVSSISALGRNENGMMVTEESGWIPSKKVSGYSESKFFSEAEVWRGIEEGLDAVIVNPSIILGPSNWENGSAKLFKTVWDGLKFYTKGVTGYVDVNDVTEAMIRLMDDNNFERVKNQRFILNSANISFQNVFNEIAEALDKPKPRFYISDMLLGIAWRAASLAGWINRKPSALPREAVADSNAINNFDGSKIVRTINFNYRPISKSIADTAEFLKQDMKKE